MTVAVLDANVLYPSVLRDVLVRAAVAGLVQAKWTNRNLDETFASLRRNRPDLSAAALTRTRELMNAAVRDALITDYEDLEPLVLGLPDPDDRHVVAAAAKARAHVIVTHNLRDFPQEALDSWQLSAVDPDDLLLDLHLDNPAALLSIIEGIATVARRPPLSIDDVIDRLGACHLPQTVAALRDRPGPVA